MTNYQCLLSLTFRTLTALSGRWAFVAGFMAFVGLSFALVPMLGSNFFPAVDGGQRGVGGLETAPKGKEGVA